MPKSVASAAESKTATFTMRQRALGIKKGSVIFENTNPDAILQNVYVMRRGVSELLGVTDLDSVQELEFTVKVKQ